ncbi:hypothetical protein HPB49_001373 [Dermacentor silvarum]|uniref:Uncharacterized protein n=1 Tax=Dermacentor silvarum TaxID=543639 RepID=A0ACB8CCW6_DERSI|nr:hypothetical protein HPB49_001373 [Dermacentor silvarum]
MPVSGPGQGSPWSASRPTESVPLECFLRNGVSTLPVALVPTDGGSIRLTESERFQEELRGITEHFVHISQHLKVVLRPREGLVFSKWPTPVIARALLTAGGYPRTIRTQNLIVRIESKQNIAVVNSSSKYMAARIRDINAVQLGAKQYAVATFIAPPANSASGVAHGNPQGMTDAELMYTLYAHGRQILQARMLGPCATALITFEAADRPERSFFPCWASARRSPGRHGWTGSLRRPARAFTCRASVTWPRSTEPDRGSTGRYAELERLAKRLAVDRPFMFLVPNRRPDLVLSLGSVTTVL